MTSGPLSGVDGAWRLALSPSATGPVPLPGRATAGEREACAFKGYADADWGQRIMHLFRAMATCPECPPDTCPVSRPLAYVPQERLLISRWAHGQTVWAHIERGGSALLQRIPSVLLHLYRSECALMLQRAPRLSLMRL